MITILASYAQEESRSASENCKWRIRSKFKDGTPTWFRVFGYKMVGGHLEVVPEEAKVVRMIFQDYLSGMGQELIWKKLFDLRIPARDGDTWHSRTISYILHNERYIGDLRRQKFFISDHLSKRKEVNHGELAQYYVKDSHELIIDRETFGAVQKRLADANFIYHAKAAPTEPKGQHPFTGKFRCGICGKNDRRKITMAGTPYSKAVWICDTFNRKGKKYCARAAKIARRRDLHE